MGFKEATEDGIRNIKDKHTNNSLYYPLCTCCGKEVMSFSYIRGNKYYCKECKLENYLSDKEKRVEESREVKDKKLQNAILRISDHAKDMLEYDKAIKAIQKYLYHDVWFESTEEIMVALELYKNKIPFRHQVKFGRYRVDFLLSNEKIVLEVDGTLFHTEKTREKEQVRDNLIILNLGAEWEVIRITDKDINSNVTNLMKAIHKIKEKRQYIRSKHNGLLPEWYCTKSI